MSTIKLSSGEKVTLVESINWGQSKVINNSMIGALRFEQEQVKQIKKQGDDDSSTQVALNGEAMMVRTMKKLEICIEKIEDENGAVVKFSRSWMDNLSVEDGDLLDDATENIVKPKKA